MLDLEFLNKKDEIVINDHSNYVLKDKVGLVIEATLSHSFSENLAEILEKLEDWKLKHFAVLPENRELKLPCNDVILIFEKDVE